MKIGIDLGTTSILIYVRGKGIVAHEASIAAVDAASGDVLALGNAAYQMIGRNPDCFEIVHPMRDGVISSFSVIHATIAHYIKKICGKRFLKPSVMICTPSSITSLERSAILELAIAAGAGKACLVDEPLAAALGSGIDPSLRSGQLVVDIGGGTSDAAVFISGYMAIARSTKVAGNAFDEAIVRYLRRERNVIVGQLTAEEIKKRTGSAQKRVPEIAIQVRGQSYISRMPVQIEISSSEAHFAMRERLHDVLELIRSVLEETPPEIAGDICDRGIVLTGGGAMLQRLDAMFGKETGLPVRVAKNPVLCVAQGLGVLLEHQSVLENSDYTFRTDDDIGEFERNRNL